jgi:hypothetical protein
MHEKLLKMLPFIPVLKFGAKSFLVKTILTNFLLNSYLCIWLYNVAILTPIAVRLYGLPLRYNNL